MAKPAATVSGLQPYPAYKPSGVEWLGDVPAHWEVRRLKAGANNVVNPTTNRRPGEMYLALEHVESWTGRLRSTAPDIGLGSQVKRFEAGDVLFGKLRPYLAKVAHPDRSGVCVGEFLVLRPRTRGLDADYLSRLLRSKRTIDAIDASTFGAKMPSAEWAFIGGLGCPLPPLSEQAAIARYLDHAERRIRRFIHTKEKLVKLLKEQRQALANEAVSGRVDVRTGQPYSAYKPSGVEWLGDVPAHWKVQRLKYAVSFTGGGTPSKANSSFWSGDVPWVSPKDMTRARLNDTVDHISNDAVAASATSIVEPGAVLIVVRSGILRRTIPVAINSVRMALNQDMKALRPTTGIVKAEYLHMLIQGNDSSLLREWTKLGATVESIEHGWLANSRIPVPPLPEQAAIARYLDQTDRRIRGGIQSAKRQVQLLEEYRTRLIADLVTGKLDVREAASQLPNGIGETESSTTPDAPAKIDPDTAKSLGANAWEPET